MKIDKVYNNNVVQIREDSGEEAIVMGKGLGFQKKVGDELDLSKIEKKFVLEDSNIANELSRVYVDLSNEEIEAVFDIIKHAQEGLGVTFEIFLWQIICISRLFALRIIWLLITHWDGRCASSFQKNFSWLRMLLKFLKRN